MEDEPEVPFWAHPVITARKIHWFPKSGAPSGCRRYIAQSTGLMTVIQRPETYTSYDRCSTCSKKAAQE